MEEITEQKLLDLDYLSGDGFLTEKGEVLLRLLLKGLPQVYKRRMKPETFFALMAKNVPACVELVIVRNGKALLTYRKDQHFIGWHTPGTYISPGETLEETVQRCANGELKCRVRFIKHLTVFSNHKDTRFHDLSNLILCEIAEGEPQAGEWFSECPPDIIPVHRKFWPVIEQCLKDS